MARHKITAAERYKALDDAAWEYWRKINRMVLAIGGQCATDCMLDGSTLNTFILHGQTFDATPPAWTAQDTLTKLKESRRAKV